MYKERKNPNRVYREFLLNDKIERSPYPRKYIHIGSECDATLIKIIQNKSKRTISRLRREDPR